MRYYVVSNVKLDGKRFPAGSTIELTEDKARQALASGAISSDKSEQKATDVTPKVEKSDDQQPAQLSGSSDGSLHDSGEMNTGKPDDQKRAEATDVTPVVLDRLNRNQLNELAKSEGVEGDIEGAATKADVITMIEAKRAATAASDPVIDPSAGL